MNIDLKLIVEDDSGEQQEFAVTHMERKTLSLEHFGLTLAEAKDILSKVQQVVVSAQSSQYVEEQRICGECQKRLGIKGHHDLVMRTVFGKLRLDSPRFYSCKCHEVSERSFSPLAKHLAARTTPELQYLETKFASLLPFGVTVELLEELLPLESELSTTQVRNTVQRISERIENELGEERHQYIEGCPRDWGNLPRPGAPITVALDGGYVRCRPGENQKSGVFEIIAGVSSSEEQSAKCFGFVNGYDQKPRRRLYNLLNEQGLQNNQQITFVSDGGDTVRELQMFLSPESEHLLDWFHVTMRLAVMMNMAKGLPKTSESKSVGERLESLKWYLWHGNVFKAREEIEMIEGDLECLEEPNDRVKKLQKLVHEFSVYIELNVNFIPNYGDRYRHGETISSSTAEATINRVVSKRFVKKQQMRWSKRGAHSLLQTRTQVLNDQLRGRFCQWYPGMEGESMAA